MTVMDMRTRLVRILVISLLAASRTTYPAELEVELSKEQTSDGRTGSLLHPNSRSPT